MTQDKDRTPVALSITTLCTKCKMQLNHIVMCHTMEGIVARVKCRTCGSEHKYHPEKKKTPRKTARVTTRTAASKKVSAAPDFAEFSEQIKNKESIPYTMSGSFKVGDVIDHATYGKGLVTKTSRQRIWVLFFDGPRTLVCDWG